MIIDFIQNREALCTRSEDARDTSREYLKDVIKYFFKLKKNGDIDEMQFNALVSLALKNFLESELIINIQKFTDDKWFQFLSEL